MLGTVRKGGGGEGALRWSVCTQDTGPRALLSRQHLQNCCQANAYCNVAYLYGLCVVVSTCVTYYIIYGDRLQARHGAGGRKHSGRLACLHSSPCMPCGACIHACCVLSLHSWRLLACGCDRLKPAGAVPRPSPHGGSASFCWIRRFSGSVGAGGSPTRWPLHAGHGSHRRRSLGAAEKPPAAIGALAPKAARPSHPADLLCTRAYSWSAIACAYVNAASLLRQSSAAGCREPFSFSRKTTTPNAEKQRPYVPMCVPSSFTLLLRTVSPSKVVFKGLKHYWQVRPNSMISSRSSLIQALKIPANTARQMHCPLRSAVSSQQSQGSGRAIMPCGPNGRPTSLKVKRRPGDRVCMTPPCSRLA